MIREVPGEDEQGKHLNHEETSIAYWQQEFLAEYFQFDFAEMDLQIEHVVAEIHDHHSH